jgi:hypothetical protein
MMKVVGKEQAGAIALEMQRDAAARKRKLKKRKILKERIACWSVSSIAVIYALWLLWAIVQVRIEMYPELGRCLIPKGQWPYEYYNNLKWVECEIK